MRFPLWHKNYIEVYCLMFKYLKIFLCLPMIEHFYSVIWDHTLYEFLVLWNWKKCADIHICICNIVLLLIEYWRHSRSHHQLSSNLIFIKTPDYNYHIHFEDCKSICSIDFYFYVPPWYALKYVLHFFSWRSKIFFKISRGPDNLK